MILKEEYQIACSTSSDINQHLPTLYEISKECNHITEMGVRSGASTRAFLYADPEKYIAYDLNLDIKVNKLFDYCKSIGKDYYYLKENVLEIEIEQTDFLFIDTYHCYEQLKQELNLHTEKVNKYIGFHDTYSFGKVGEDGGKGLRFAIEEFLDKNINWKVVHDVDYNNGLMIIERK